MAKQVDSYAPCSCGSGEKLKFCCQKILAEMDDVYEALSRDRVAAARAALDKARPKAAGSKYSEAWVATMSAVLIGRDQGPGPALNELKPVLEKTPDFALAWIVASQLLLGSERLDEAMGALEQALGNLKIIPSPLVPLLGELAIAMNGRHEFLTSIYLATLAVSLAKDTASEELVDLWEQLRTEPRASLLLRTPPTLSMNVRGTPAGDKATAAFGRGQMRIAARHFRECAEVSQAADDWARLGIALCYAGLSREAIPALKKAAELEQDFERSVEFEALAQQLARDLTLPRQKGVNRTFDVGDFAALSHYFDADPRVQRTPVRGDDNSSIPAVSHWAVLSRPMPPADQPCSPESVPVVAARFSLFSVPEENSRKFLLYALVTPGIGEEKIIDDIVAGAKEWISPRERTEPEGYPLEVVSMIPEQILPDTLRPHEAINWLRACSDHLVENVWSRMPLSGLDGKTPLEAKDDPARRRALAAAILVLVTMPHSLKQFLDENDLRSRFGLPPVAEFETPRAGVNELSLAEARRWKLSSLSLEELNDALTRLMPLMAPTIIARYVVELASRPLDGNERLNAHLMAGRMLHQLSKSADALHHLAQARSLADSVNMPFEARIQFDLVDLKVHAEAGDLDRARELAHSFWNKYATKIPAARSSLAAQFTMLVGEGPWSSTLDLSTGMAAPETGGFTSSGLWTPDENPSADPAKKLWLPGS